MHSEKKHFFGRFKLLVILVVLLVQSNCVLSTDEIHKVLFHEYNDTSYMILHLFNFHAIDGSYEKGNVRTSGYNESEIAIYNLTTQKLIAKQKIGVYNDTEAFEILGCSDSLIWIYSKIYKSGLQAIHIKTLNRQISQAKIYSSLPNWQGRFFEPEWNNISDYYGFNTISNNIIVNNYLKKQFYINTQTLDIIPIEPKINVERSKPDFISKIVYVHKDTLELYDEYLQKNNLTHLPDHQFIKGGFIVEQNLKRKNKYYNNLLFDYSKKLDSIQNKLSRIKAMKNSPVAKELNLEKDWLNSKIKDVQTNIKDIDKGNKSDNIFLSNDSSSFFVLQRTNKSNNSDITISKISTKDNQYYIPWEISIPGMYFNVTLAQNTKEFKRLFGHKTPESNFMHCEIIDKQLIIIYLLQICSINIDTGNIIWKTKL